MEKYFKHGYRICIEISDIYYKVTSLESTSLTVKTFFSLYVVSFLVEHICFTCLVWTTFNFWMLQKLAYKFKGDQINGLYDTVYTKVNETFTKVESMIPRYRGEKLKSN
jgi:hypothetical protein